MGSLVLQVNGGLTPLYGLLLRGLVPTTFLFWPDYHFVQMLCLSTKLLYFLADVCFFLPLGRSNVHGTNSTHFLGFEVFDALNVAVTPHWAKIGREVLAWVLAIDILVVIYCIQKVLHRSLIHLRGRDIYTLTLAHLSLYSVEKTPMTHGC